MLTDKRNEEVLDDDYLIEMTDEAGNVFYYVEEMIIPVDGVNFALLVEVKDEPDHEHGEHCGCDCDCDCGAGSSRPQAADMSRPPTSSPMRMLFRFIMLSPYSAAT